MPHLRRALLFTGDWERSVPFYEQLMGMTVLGGQPGAGPAIMQWKGPGHLQHTVWRSLASATEG